MGTGKKNNQKTQNEDELIELIPFTRKKNSELILKNEKYCAKISTFEVFSEPKREKEEGSLE